MIKRLTCIECPISCALSVDIENCRVVKVAGNKCPKGLEYAKAEIENPVRFFTSTVLSDGLEIKMIPIRTSAPILKTDIPNAVDLVKKIKISKPVKSGEVIVHGFLGKSVDLVATRDCP